MKPVAGKSSLSDLVDMDDPRSVLAEVLRILRLISKDFDPRWVRAAYADMVRLFRGRYPGYQACNTEYHDIGHTTDTVLATVRLMHGASAKGRRFSGREIDLAVISAVFHDAGYIQAADDTEGTGAKYTAVHVDRSIDFAARYFRERGFPKDYPKISAAIMGCTGINVKISGIKFESGAIELLGKMLGAGDLLGQMAAANYLEKLLFLFYEFQEGRIPGFSDEFDLLKKTLDFYKVTRKRLAGDFGSVDRFMRPHFRSRWGLDRDLYDEAIRSHMTHLKELIRSHPDDYRRFLRQEGLSKKLRRIHGGRPGRVRA